MGILLLLFRHRIVSYVVGLNYEIRPCAKAWALGAILCHRHEGQSQACRKGLNWGPGSGVRMFGAWRVLRWVLRHMDCSVSFLK